MDSLRNDVYAQLARKEYDHHCVVRSTAVSEAIINLMLMYKC